MSSGSLWHIQYTGKYTHRNQFFIIIYSSVHKLLVLLWRLTLSFRNRFFSTFWRFSFEPEYHYKSYNRSNSALSHKCEVVAVLPKNSSRRSLQNFPISRYSSPSEEQLFFFPQLGNGLSLSSHGRIWWEMNITKCSSSALEYGARKSFLSFLRILR